MGGPRTWQGIRRIGKSINYAEGGGAPFGGVRILPALVEEGGVFLAMKGPGYEEEVKEAKRALEILGGGIADRVQFQIPYTDITHYIVIIKR